MNKQQPDSWAKFRMPTWEEDISLNHDAGEPFENSIPPAEISREEFDCPHHLTDELLDGIPLETYIAKDGYPIPSPEDREGYNPHRHAQYFLNGLSDYLKILQTARKHDVEIGSFFDFGCASGRVLRHFCCQSDIERLWGSDINGRHIKWLNDYLPRKLKIIHNHCIPNLQIADQSIDVISAFSVFTHIDIFETAWMAELHRILSPEGMVYLTVHNEDTWKYLQQPESNKALLNRMRDVRPEVDEMLKSDLPAGRTDFRYTDVGPYRALVFHSNDYLERTWGRYFDILEIIPLWHGYFQSVFVGRKRD